MDKYRTPHAMHAALSLSSCIYVPALIWNDTDSTLREDFDNNKNNNSNSNISSHHDGITLIGPNPSTALGLAYL